MLEGVLTDLTKQRIEEDLNLLETNEYSLGAKESMRAPLFNRILTLPDGEIKTNYFKRYYRI